MDNVTILNADYVFLNTVSWRRAITLLIKGKAESLKNSAKYIITTGGKKIFIPIIMKLIKIVRMVYRNKVPFSKKNIYTRDENKCMYCGVESKNLTIDHIVPKSRGGKTSWENCVASCKQCNSYKANKTPKEAHMSLIKQPHQPTINEFLMIKMKEKGIDSFIEELFQKENM